MVILQNPNNVEPDLTETPRFSEDLDSACSTPYVSAPSSPGRGPLTAGYFFSAPASPMHYVLSSGPSATCHSSESALLSTQSDFEFDFSSRFSSNGSVAVGSMTMSSADELFLNGQIRPMKLSSHLQRPQILAPLLDLDVEEDDYVNKGDGEETAKRGRDLKLRSRSLHRKARSLSPLRNQEFEWHEEDIDTGKDVSEKILELQDYVDRKESEEAVSSETTPSCSASSSRSSSSGRNSKKWIFLKDLLYRSKSEGRGNGKEKFWSSISFSPSKEKKLASTSLTLSKEDKSSPPDASSNETQEKPKQKQKQKQKRNEQSSVKKTVTGKPANGISKRRVPRSAHELHYTANRAQAEEMKKRTYLPYRQGLFGCLGFSSKGYGALNGLAKTLNPVSSRMDAGGGA